MTMFERSAEDPRSLPERWPVLGPFAGMGVGSFGTAFAIVEGDWVAAVVFAIPAALLGSVALRNARLPGRHCPDEGDERPTSS